MHQQQLQLLILLQQLQEHHLTLDSRHWGKIVRIVCIQRLHTPAYNTHVSALAVATSSQNIRHPTLGDTFLFVSIHLIISEPMHAIPGMNSLL